jgi:hypothetical protein
MGVTRGGDFCFDPTRGINMNNQSSNKEKEKSEKKQQGRPSIGAPPAKKRVLSSTKKETKGASQAASQSEKFMLEIIHGEAGAKAKEPRKPLKLQIEQDQTPLASAPRTPIGLNCGV